MRNVHFINAGAGSGKTYRLTEVFCRLLEKGAEPSEFILTTYTKAAADEFRSKIKARLYDEGMGRHAANVDAAGIGTIHSVAQSYIRKYWYLLGITPDISVMEDKDVERYVNLMLEDLVTDEDVAFFNKYCEKMRIYQNTASQGRSFDYNFWKGYVLKLVENMKSYGFDIGRLAEFKENSLRLADEMYPDHPYDRNVFLKYVQELADFFGKNKSGQKFLDAKVKPMIGDGGLVDGFVKPVLDQFEKSSAAYMAGAPDDIVMEINAVQLSGCRPYVTECCERVFRIAGDLYRKVDDFKKEMGFVEFSDLEQLFHDLLKLDIVREDIACSVKYVLVDEFQDINPIQYRIFDALSEIVTQSYWVGDPKQAIYGFRGSDSSLANSVISEFPEIKDDESSPTGYKRNQAGLSMQKLDVSRRSFPALVEAANKSFINAFALLNGNEALGEDLVKLNPWDEKKELQDACDGNVFIHEWWTDASTVAGRYSALAAELYHMFKEGKPMIPEKKGGEIVLRPIRYGDVAVLSKTNEDCRQVADALKAKGIPVSIVGSALGDQAEVCLVLTLLKYVGGVDTRLSEAELQKLYSDESLEGVLSDLLCKRDTPLKNYLDGLKNRCGRHSVADMIKELIAALDLNHYVARWSNALDRRANLNTLMKLSAGFLSGRNGASVSEFIDYVSTRKETAPFDNTGDTVKVLTYYKSKGLQWKFVVMTSLDKDVLDDTSFIGKNFCGVRVDGEAGLCFVPPAGSMNAHLLSTRFGKPGFDAAYEKLKEKVAAEETRLLYVGFTRAENHVVYFSSPKPKKWLENAKVVFDPAIPRREISDDQSIIPVMSDSVSVIRKELLFSDKTGDPKRLIPSSLKGSAGDVKVKTVEISGPMSIEGMDDVRADEFGTCVHNCFAVYDHGNHAENQVKTACLIGTYGLGGHLRAEDVVGRAGSLYEYVEREYGRIRKAWRELPFCRRRDGQVITGEIDLYLELENGMGILVDYKNPVGTAVEGNVMGVAAEKALKYAPQLGCYKEALETAGRNVTHVFVYYPVWGVLAEL